MTPGAAWQVGERITLLSSHRQFQVEEIRAGGMGIVYVVTDVKNSTPLVIKGMRPQLVRSGVFRARFEREAMAWINLKKHPNIVQALSFQPINGQPHIFLEYISGGNLRDLLSRTELMPIPGILRLGVEICRGMRHAVATGVNAHRDLKPDNILITAEGNAKVTDFGLVKLLDETVLAGMDEQERSEIGLIAGGGLRTDANAPAFGTKEYMPPEQWRSAAKADIRSDVYAFGVMLYEMLTSIRPFYAKDPITLRDKHFNVTPSPPSSLRPDIPPAVDNVVMRCLQKHPDQRFQDFAHIEQRLTRILQHEYREVIPLLTQEQMTIGEINERGTALFHLKRYPEALSCFNDVLRKDARSRVAWANRAVILAETSRPEEALRSFEMALKYKPDDPVVLTNKGMTLSELGHYDEALVCYTEATQYRNVPQEVWRYSSEVLNRLGRHTEAFEAAVKARTLNRDDALAYYQEALAALMIHRYQHAIEAVAQFERLEGARSPSALVLRARIAFYEGQYKESCRLCGNVDRSAPEYKPALMLNVESALALADLDEIEVLLPDVLESETISRSVLALMTEAMAARTIVPLRLLVYTAEIALRARDFITAERCYREWMSRVGDLGESPTARPPHFTVRDVWERRPPDAHHRIAQGALLLQLGKPELAVQCLRAGVEALPDDVEGWRQLGEAYNTTASFRRSMQSFERVTRLMPQDCAAWQQFAESALRVEKYQVALDAAEQAARLDETAIVAFLRGAALFGLGRHHQALRQFEKALDADDNLAVAWWNKGLCARRLGRGAEANRCKHRARALDVRFWRMLDHHDRPMLPYPLVSETLYPSE